MRVELLQPEPDLEFGNEGRCPDIRFGIGHYGVFDFANVEGPRQIKIGLIGTDETLEPLADWLEKCRHEIPAKISNQPRLYVPFPGFDVNHSFHSNLIWNRNEFRTVTISPSMASLKK